jgi:hypothetical protein
MRGSIESAGEPLGTRMLLRLRLPTLRLDR